MRHHYNRKLESKRKQRVNRLLQLFDGDIITLIERIVP